MAGQKKTAKAQAAATPAPVPAPEAVEETKDPVEIRQLEAEVALETLASLRAQIKDLESFLKSYVKDTTKMLRQYEKKAADAEAKAATGGRRVRRAPNPNKKPSGFAKKTKITPDFVKFMTDADVKKVIAEVVEEEKGKADSKFEPMDGENKITRPSATKVVNAYIRVKGLQDPSSRQFIRPDAKLKKLLTPLNEDDQKKGGYSFFNLQRYMRHLYVKE